MKNALHEALAAELLTAEKCCAAIEHAYIEANPLRDRSLDAVLSVAIDRQKDALEKASKIEKSMRQITS